jgi:hypothetical protein
LITGYGIKAELYARLRSAIINAMDMLTAGTNKNGTVWSEPLNGSGAHLVIAVSTAITSRMKTLLPDSVALKLE